jgi:hypothetical protein
VATVKNFVGVARSTHEIATCENGKHATDRDGVEFYTEKKVVIERW